MEDDFQGQAGIGLYSTFIIKGEETRTYITMLAVVVHRNAYQRVVGLVKLVFL
jgi:hypothetical protein